MMAASTIDSKWPQPPRVSNKRPSTPEMSNQTSDTRSPLSSTLSCPSDDDHTLENGSLHSESSARPQSNSSSISEVAADDEIPKIGQKAAIKNEESLVKPRSRSSTLKSGQDGHDVKQRLTAAEIHQLTSSPGSLPIAPASPQMPLTRYGLANGSWRGEKIFSHSNVVSLPEGASNTIDMGNPRNPETMEPQLHRTASNPLIYRQNYMERSHPGSVSPRRNSITPLSRPDLHSPSLDRAMPTLSVNTITPPLSTAARSPDVQPARVRTASAPPSPHPQSIPLPPMSLPTHLQLELAAQRPSPLYIHQPYHNDMPYESSAIKFERLKNVFALPPFLERTLYFGALACLDSWLYNFTILPVRFLMAVSILLEWWVYVVKKEGKWLIYFVWSGLGRLWQRARTGRLRQPSASSSTSKSKESSDTGDTASDPGATIPTTTRDRHSGTNRRTSRTGGYRPETPYQNGPTDPDQDSRAGVFRHRRTKSIPSKLSTFHKADLLQGAVIICSSLALMSLDASRMYHFIRAQSAIKLYVIYNILEVGDRLLSAIGQDIFECLFSAETLSRNASGRSKVFLPFGMFMLALLYNCLHSIALYYQVITLNVAVNSYSNALLTLLMSNQFVEIKSTVFKRFEKDNLFQLTCADIVERFQLWIMLLIIGMRNAVEVGGLSVPGAGSDGSVEDATSSGLHNGSILPHSFTVLPAWLKSGEVLSPFLIVIGSEMLVDSIKHAYVTKFNNIKPRFYSRILDILCKDYYTNAFTTPSLTRRLGLAVIPLSCLFIRASIQTYHMFLSTHLPVPIPKSTQTSLSEESAVPSSPAMLAALNRFDSLLRDSLGRATYGYPYGSPLNQRPWYAWTSDDFIAALTMVVFFFIAFLVLLILKLLLGMVLLKYSRNRYVKMKQKEQLSANGKIEKDLYDAAGRRVGGYGTVEVGDDRSRWINSDKAEGLKGRAFGKRVGREEGKKVEGDYDGVFRFEMVNKRIW